MMIRQNKVVLNLRDPDRILTVIPTAKTIVYKGVTLVVVPHKLDETKVLNNMGIDVPSPVGYYYDWPGRFIPFDHQKVTTEFLVKYNRSFCLNDMGCVDAETEYLSPTGWVKISEYSGGEVAQYIPTSGKAEFVSPTEYVKKPCIDMVRIKTKYGLDQLLSPEHRVLLERKDVPGTTEVLQAVALRSRHDAWVLGGKSTKHRREIGWSKAAVPVVFDGQGGCGVGLKPEALRVQIAVIADGHFPNKTNRCVVRLKKERKKMRIRTLLTVANIEFVERNTEATGYSTFSFHAPIRTKEFGVGFWNASKEDVLVVCDEIMHWDGSVSSTKTTERFSSYSKLSADFVQYAFSSTGRTARMTESKRIRRGKEEVEYTVLVRDNGKPLQLCSMDSKGRRMSVISDEKSPDGFKYCFVVPSTFLVFRRNGCVFASGNTGKSLSGLWAYDYMRSVQKADKLLIISPLSTLERTWSDEIFHNFPHLNFSVLHGTRDRRFKLLNQDAEVYIINHDGLKTPGIPEALAERLDIDTVIIDEISQAGRNASTARWKALKKATIKKQTVWGFTGTPTPNGPTDAWAQCRLVNPSTVPPYFTAFRDQVMRKVTTFKFVPRDTALDIVSEAMQPSIRFKRDECIDLPPLTYETRSVDLSPQQAQMYKEMVSKLHSEYEGGSVTAVNEAVKMMKLVQIACGVVYGSDGEDIIIPAQDRLNVTREIIEEAGSKVIVFVPFTSALESVAEFLRKYFTVEVVSGGTSKADRDRIFGDFQIAPDPRVIVANAGVMSHGLTLVAASTIIWFAPITSADTFEQAGARISRPGQKLNQLIVMIEGSPIERAMYKKLQGNIALQGSLLEMIKDKM